MNIKGKEIHSIQELRNQFDLVQVTEAFADGSLLKWLEDCYYEQETDQVGKLRREWDSERGGDAWENIFHIFKEEEKPAEAPKEVPIPTQMALCRILGVNYSQAGGLSQEEAERCRVIREKLSRHTQDPAVLNKAAETATNQAELGGLLNQGITTIYLCDGPFSVPIRKAGVHYIGVGGPRVESSFTEEQYRKAGITFEGVSLPDATDPGSVETAAQAAKANGYDDFSESHNRFATAIHNAMNAYPAYETFLLKADGHKVAGEFYQSKSEMESEIRKAVTAAYEEAQRFLAPDSDAPMVSKVLKHYARVIPAARKCLDQVEPLLSGDGKGREKWAELREMVVDQSHILQVLFQEELEGSADYYALYDKQYFIDQVTIDELDLNEDPFDSDLLNGLARLIADKTEYSAVDLLSVLSELTKDVNQRLETFLSTAHSLYQSYLHEVEEMAQELGAGFSDEDLRKVGLLKE